MRSSEVYVIGAFQDYTSEIKKLMTGAVIQAMPPRGYHWESLFIWAIKR